jgi:formamidopyrimidine-DNA glycosylase
MSIELPEAHILGKQMQKQLVGKEIIECNMQEYERAQKIGFINKEIKDFQKLVGGSISGVTTKGTMILIHLDNDMNLLLGPEYGGKYFYHDEGSKLPKKWHMKLSFSDNTYLSGRLSGMGVLKALSTTDLQTSYIYKREHSGILSPLDKQFTFKHFSALLSTKNRQLKSVLVGKEAIISGLMNSAFQDVLYRARIHPKRRASDLSEDEQIALYDAIKALVHERLTNDGKDQERC